MRSEVRQRIDRIMVRVSPGEKLAIREQSSRYSLSAPAYLRSLGLGFEPKSTMDQQVIDRLSKLHGDLGRVGGLLKLSLNNSTTSLEHHQSIRELINRLSELRLEIKETVSRL